MRKNVGGIEFVDPYAWLGEESEDALAWQRKQNALAVDAATSIPFFDPLVDRIRSFRQDATESFGAAVRAGGLWFRVGSNESGTAQAIVISEGLDGPARRVIDAAALGAGRSDHRPVHLLHVDPSPDGRLFAFTTGAGGDMNGSIRVAETESGRILDVEVPVLLFNLPLPGWMPNGSGFFVQDRAEDGRHQLRFIPVTEDAHTRDVVSFELSDVAATMPGLVPQVSPGGRYVAAVTVPHEHIVAMLGDIESGTWRRFLPDDYAGECYGDWLDDERYLAIVTGSDDPRGRVVVIPARTSQDRSRWHEVVPSSSAVLKALALFADGFALAELVDVSLRIRLFRRDGTPDGEIELPPNSSSPDFTAPPRLQRRSEELLFNHASFLRPSTLVRYDPATKRLRPVGDPPKELEGLEVQQRFAVSKDSTRVPYWIVHRGDRDESTPLPTLVNAYGGFNLPWTPSFLHHFVPFVRSGGNYVHACLRGGSEYGRDWYDAGRLQHKQNTFDDLRAVAQDLIGAGISSPDLLAFHGASNGGLLAGVAVVQQADLWRVVAPFVPLFDMLEPLADSPGAEAVRSYYLQDYGDPRVPKDAAVLASYSPYHNIVDGTAYPAVFSVFGEKDVGCPPFHGRKFTARLQAATSSGHPVLMRVWEDVGHGSAISEVGVRQHAEWLAFVMDQLGMTLAED